MDQGEQPAHTYDADAAEIYRQPRHVCMMSNGAAALSVKLAGRCVIFESTRQNAQSIAESQGQDHTTAGDEWYKLLNRRPPEEDPGRNTTIGRESI
ncbi:hypothetical protein PGTUg99_000337 [Puccinia graminis f. sp. tritici]|uniref:Uncharacterized protein n=1 Tax=Puccinia graminis f. sp. tritici TaxID=56615 RepID=A0A5B0P8L9_PUCGR|nr:hypothetical protein PGTUg99_000422 [Puccinia graminis f. sp. tritici]KAA1114007.1 hypothetical protein PGTUg99_000337 [Puccinia graminis f. sp. tritici]